MDARPQPPPRGAAPRERLVVLTREAGKNGELAAALAARGVPTLELPLVTSAPGPDRGRLPDALRARRYSWVVLTSPEAAAVFLEGWRAAGRPAVRVAVVGGGTGRVLAGAPGGDAPPPAWAPSVANAEHLAPELPFDEPGPDGACSVLYPASAKAAPTLQDGLAARGFAVERLDTYDTVPVAPSALEPAAAARAARAAVVALASPSAVRAWVAAAGGAEAAAAGPAAACIGGTSARAAAKAGLARVFFPEAPGLEGFAGAVMQALDAEGV